MKTCPICGEGRYLPGRTYTIPISHFDCVGKLEAKLNVWEDDNEDYADLLRKCEQTEAEGEKWCRLAAEYNLARQQAETDYANAAAGRREYAQELAALKAELTDMGVELVRWRWVAHMVWAEPDPSPCDARSYPSRLAEAWEPGFSYRDGQFWAAREETP